MCMHQTRITWHAVHVCIGLSLMHFLQRDCHTSIIKYFLERGANPKHEDVKAQNALLLAVR